MSIVILYYVNNLFPTCKPEKQRSLSPKREDKIMRIFLYSNLKSGKFYNLIQLTGMLTI